MRFIKRCVQAIIPLLIFSCASYKSMSQENQNEIEVSSITFSKIAGKFNYLCMSTEQFRKLKKDKYVFHYYLDNDGVLTMKGWKDTGAVGRTSLDTSSVTLRAWKQGDCNFESAFFGDHVLNHKSFKEINKSLDKATKYIVFVPVCDGKIITYKIKITNDEIFPKKNVILKTATLRDVDAEANPSPPKNFY